MAIKGNEIRKVIDRRFATTESTYVKSIRDRCIRY